MSNAARKSVLERALQINPGIVWLALGLVFSACAWSLGYSLWMVFELNLEVLR